MKEPAGAARLRRVAPWLLLLAVGVLLLVPGIIAELGDRPTDDLRSPVEAESSVSTAIALSRDEIHSER